MCVWCCLYFYYHFSAPQMLLYCGRIVLCSFFFCSYFTMFYDYHFNIIIFFLLSAFLDEGAAANRGKVEKEKSEFMDTWIRKGYELNAHIMQLTFRHTGHALYVQIDDHKWNIKKREKKNLNMCIGTLCVLVHIYTIALI